MFCTNCGAPMNDNQAVCLSCGVKTNVGKNFCSNCGNAVAPNAEVCLGCGVALNNTAANGYGKYDKLVIALVCFFLGGIGIHNFMLGETKKGVVKIVLSFLCGIGGILALIDFIKILMDKYEVNPDKAF